MPECHECTVKWGYVYRAEVELLQGQLAAGHRSVQRSATAQLEQRNPGTALQQYLIEIWTHLEDRGDTAAARSALDGVLKASPLDSIETGSRPWAYLIRLRASLGETAEARRLLTRYDRDVPPKLREHDGSLDRALAQLALAEGRAREAIPLARRGGLDCGGCTADLIGRSFDQLGQRDSAIAAYERALGPPTYGSDFNNFRPAIEPRAMYRLGQLYEETGQKRLARERYASFVDLWQRADPELQPVVRAARDRLTALSGER